MFRYKSELLRPVWAQIDLDAIKHNLETTSRLVGAPTKLMAVVKAEAYGHGAAEVARVAVESGVEWLAVSIPEEGISLREQGFINQILVLGPLIDTYAHECCTYDLTCTITTLSNAISLAKASKNKTVKVHIKVDTGMRRIGVSPDHVVNFIRTVRMLPNIEIEGLYTHFYSSDNLEITEKQMNIFKEVMVTLESMDIKIPLKHVSNSGAIINMPEYHLDLVRAGIMLYGLYPDDKTKRKALGLMPALSLRTRVTHVTRVSKGEGIGYGHIFKAKQETTIVTLPIGYADGWARLLKKKAYVLINGKRFPIVGNICMDQCMVDVGDDLVIVGEEVVLIGRQGNEEITIDEVSDKLHTINHEIVCMISDRVPRIYKSSFNDFLTIQ